MFVLTGNIGFQVFQFDALIFLSEWSRFGTTRKIEGAGRGRAVRFLHLVLASVPNVYWAFHLPLSRNICFANRGASGIVLCVYFVGRYFANPLRVPTALLPVYNPSCVSIY